MTGLKIDFAHRAPAEGQPGFNDLGWWARESFRTRHHPGHGHRAQSVQRHRLCRGDGSPTAWTIGVFIGMTNNQTGRREHQHCQVPVNLVTENRLVVHQEVLRSLWADRQLDRIHDQLGEEPARLDLLPQVCRQGLSDNRDHRAIIARTDWIREALGRPTTLAPMKHRPFIGARIEDAFTRRLNDVLRRQGWQATIIPYTGYGNQDHVRVLGRLVLQPNKPRTDLGRFAESVLNKRGWRNFLTAAVPHGEVVVKLGDHHLSLTTDRSGYLDVSIRAHALEPGWRQVILGTDDATPVGAPVHVVSSEETFGLISDIDDTVLTTWLPRLFLAAWNSFVQTEGNRQAVPGMARMYQKLLADHPGAPIVYISTGAWGTLPFINRFLKRHGYPSGAMLMTDWGPTNTGFFRSGRDHKLYSMHELARDFPNIKWVLIGDDGQHDPSLYRTFAELQPEHVRAIAIRKLSTAEQVLAHGTTTVLPDYADLEWRPAPVPEVSGDDGDELSIALAEVTARSDLG